MGQITEHSSRVADYAALTAEELALDAASVARVRLAARLHDLGKRAIPSRILDKPGPLTAEEKAIVELHPQIGARIVRGIGESDLYEWVLAHHEHFDGRGYPLGLRGDEIPLQARILAVADAFDAMISDRPYRLALGEFRAWQELFRGAGTQFDPDVVGAFSRRRPDLRGVRAAAA